MTVVDQAENVGGVVAAARLRESFKRRQANARDEEQRAALGDAIGTLEMRFPELEDLPAGGAESFARERGHGRGSRSPSHEGRTRPGAKARSRQQPDAAPLERAARKAGTPPARKAGGGDRPSAEGRSKGSGPRQPRPKQSKPRGGTRTDRRVRSVARTAYRQTGIPAASSSTTQIAMSALGATVGLSALYLVVTSGEKRGAAGHALPELLNAVTGFLRRVVAPVDFFGPMLTADEYRRAVAAPGSPAVLKAELPRVRQMPKRFRRAPKRRNPILNQTKGLDYGSIRHPAANRR
jgi:hypothetical protein